MPSCLVNYQRLAFQDAAGYLLLTIDVDVSFYAPPQDLWERSVALVRGSFGAPVAVERRALVEVKSRAELPAWLAELLLETRLEPTPYRKFVRAGRSVYGEV